MDIMGSAQKLQEETPKQKLVYRDDRGQRKPNLRVINKGSKVKLGRPPTKSGAVVLQTDFLTIDEHRVVKTIEEKSMLETKAHIFQAVTKRPVKY